jgi:hypothetical protein
LGCLAFLIVSSAILGSCGTVQTTPDPQAAEAALEQVTMDGQALTVDVLTGGERQSVLGGAPFVEAFAAQQVKPDRVRVATAAGVRISVVALSAPQLPAVSWTESYVAALVTSSDRQFTEVEQRSLGGKEITALRAAVDGCSNPCVDRVVVYPAGATVYIIQADTLERASALVAQLP